ncbi:ABC transporter permease [Ancylobacter vacuolatus]|uniref:Spermidine/putrescine transport system permease protein n=1 Tax=Ancylobacter vacuolatus TaxID=223389 RepID=A0ABU0DDT6_9HYPH|nr:ABC transporter permease [Ancylobacter vacuolatus]MDQ0346560.1 spermidine/putrescine transport system permease protein [Ancylobacter vacuolatus]
MSGSLAFVFGLPLAVVVFFFALAAYERRTGVASGGGFFQRNGLAIGLYLVLAVGFWAFFIILLPQLAMVDMSFRPKLPPSQMGGPKDLYTLENYRYFLFGSTTSTAEWNWLHIKAFFLTIGVSIVITLINFAICYPLAFHMAQSATAARLRVLLLLLILPYWVNEILRAFAFRVLLSSGGIINQMLMGSGLTDEPIDFLGADVGLYMGLSYAYLLMMIFPLYNAIESLDKNQVEAARDLGAPWWHIHAFIVLPHAKPGIASGCTLVFMLTAGALAAPLVLGGPRTLWFTPIVYDRFYQAFNWPQGAAYAFILLVSCIIFVLVVLKAFRLSLGEITR